MSQYDRLRAERDTHFKGVWRRLVAMAGEGLELAPEETRALQIRSACFLILDFNKAIYTGELDPQDAVSVIPALAQYFEAHETLRQLGVLPEMQIDRPNEDYDDTTVLAEFLGGQWLYLNQLYGVPSDQALRHMQEMSEIQSTVGDIQLNLIPTQFMTGILKAHAATGWLAHRTDLLFARELGDPSLPATESPN